MISNTFMELQGSRGVALCFATIFYSPPLFLASILTLAVEMSRVGSLFHSNKYKGGFSFVNT